MIQFSQVVKRYPGGYEALKNISFEIDNGEMVLLSGHSGAGKSTLLKLIAGIERPTSGNVIVNGQHVGQLKEAALPYLRRNIGLIFQDHKLLFDRSVLDNVLLPLAIIGFKQQDAIKRASAALERVGLLDRAAVNPIHLSGGEQQRLCIARAIVHRPSIVLADEPTGNLDHAYAEDIMDLFESFNQVGVTIVLSTHDEGFLKHRPHRILRLKNGGLSQ
ncbi:cell division transport system ATP-binding protein [Chitinivorax tropicus]|uniref:Cell division ATP-binding protein FtsE n=1 Tax=Chitinivorax tropicus TaxID=714531 RepID=A0A840MDL5_9PROT|nr:cell division ATP-binding protein FtsE [Chitinivorax tropicus]MBB5017394.1 cell division transport system ATP-binding protein [Chitinivorax tropicus]